MARTPKVYAAEIDGLHDWIVAAPNQAEALAAFGVNQNLFSQGLAAPTDDPAAVRAALDAPGAPLRRLKGSKGAFKAFEAGGSEGWARAAKAVGVRAKPKARALKPDRRRIAAAEAALAKFEAKARDEAATLDREAEALERRRQAAASDHDERREELRRAVETARDHG